MDSATESNLRVAFALIVLFLSCLYAHYRYKATKPARPINKTEDEPTPTPSRPSPQSLCTSSEASALCDKVHASSSHIVDIIKSVLLLDDPSWRNLQSIITTSYLHHQLTLSNDLVTHLQTNSKALAHELTDQLETARSVLDKVAQDYSLEKRTTEELTLQLERRSILVADLADELLKAKALDHTGLSRPSDAKMPDSKIPLPELIVLQKTMVKLQSDNEALKIANVNLTISRDEILQQLNNIKSPPYITDLNRKIIMLEEQANSLASQKERLSTDATQLQSSLKTLQDERNRAAINLVETRRALDENVNALRDTRDELATIKHERDTVVATLTTTQKTLKDVSTSYEHASKELNNTRDKYEMAVKEVDALFVEKTAFMAIKTDNTALRNKTEALQSLNTSLETEIQVLQSTIPTLRAELEVIRLDHHKLKVSHDFHEKEVGIWKIKYENEHVEYNSTREKSYQLEVSYSRLKEEYEALEAARDKREKELHQTRTTLTHIQFEHDSLAAEHTRVNALHSQLQSDYNRITKELNETRSLLVDQIQLTDTAQSLLKDLKSNLVPDLNATINANAEKLKALEALVSRQKEEFEAELSRASTVHSHEISVLRNEADSLRKEANALRGQITLLQADVSEKVAELNHAKHSNEILKVEISNVSKERDAAELNYQDTLVEETEIRQKAQSEVVALIAKNLELNHQIAEMEACRPRVLVADVGSCTEEEEHEEEEEEEEENDSLGGIVKGGNNGDNSGANDESGAPSTADSEYSDEITLDEVTLATVDDSVAGFSRRGSEEEEEEELEEEEEEKEKVTLDIAISATAKDIATTGYDIDVNEKDDTTLSSADRLIGRSENAGLDATQGTPIELEPGKTGTSTVNDACYTPSTGTDEAEFYKPFPIIIDGSLAEAEGDGAHDNAGSAPNDTSGPALYAGTDEAKLCKAIPVIIQGSVAESAGVGGSLGSSEKDIRGAPSTGTEEEIMSDSTIPAIVEGDVAEAKPVGANSNEIGSSAKDISSAPSTTGTEEKSLDKPSPATIVEGGVYPSEAKAHWS
ncbi:hypothetical protein SeLEV6574_g07187 [Synchytrium endobioticum]|nr:hypothetical protein SeLEV6574_g07187 [Synchytrium endobioticum]